tara:strand:- start:5651 stop:7543 length:1893 start_codon:yes stop_codon:yes gene_type:complete
MKSKTKLESALEYLDRGWSIIPIKPEAKRPAIKWLDFQSRLPTEDEVTDWWTKFPDYDIAIITGVISGVVVVDCDNEEAEHAAYDAEMRSVIKVKTKRGIHLYFEHPKDGVRRGPRAGVNSRGADWPKINGLDFRGDGSYALLPPSKNYKWDYEQTVFDWDEMPVWKDWRPLLKERPVPGSFSFSELDLSSVNPIHPDELLSEWDRTAKFVRDNFPTSLKIPCDMGNGRNERVMRFISECIKEGFFGAELRVRGYAFMKEFFESNLNEREFEATVLSMEASEKRNHPDRFDDKGLLIHHREEKSKTRKLIQMKDAEQLLKESSAKTYLIEPWLPPNTIVQVFGYSGHGKSMFVQHAMAALCAGRKYFGCFEIGRPARVLYLDFEMGMSTIAKRLIEMKQVHGDTQDRLNIWTPFVDKEEINLHNKESLNELQEWIKFSDPDVIVIDTIRSAYPGMAENSADEWSKVNQLAVKLRNSGLAVILVHHSNKPSDNGMGREAGSTNQLTVLETQIRITQVFNDAETAKNNAAIFDGNYENPVWPLLESKLPSDFRLYMVTEVRYGKVREWTDIHDRVQWIGYASHNKTDEKCIVSSLSTKQIAKNLALTGSDPIIIADKLNRPLRLIWDWLEIE